MERPVSQRLAGPVGSAQQSGGRARRIADDLREQITHGVYLPGEALPSTRALAAELGVSRGTVTAAYEQLHAEGFLEASQGARTRVAGRVDPARPAPARREAQPPPAVSAWSGRLAALPPPQPRVEGAAIDFRYGDLHENDFPILGWKRVLDAVALKRPDRLGYDAPAGLSGLRRILKAYLWRSRGLRCDADQIIVVNGSQQGIDLLARVLVDAGDSVVIEHPCYPMASSVFAACGARLVPVPVDDDGLRTEALAAIDKARLAFVTPSHQFPLGGVLSAERRREIIAWAERSGAWVIEDDYDGEFRYHARPAPPLHVLAPDRVIYLGTASKSLSPRLRLGWLVAPPPLAQLLVRAKGLLDRHTSALGQEALAAFIEGGAYERHIRRVRRRYAERRAALTASLAEALGDRIRISGADAGLHLIVWFDDIPASREAELVEAARAEGVGVYGVAPLYGGGLGAPKVVAGLVLGYAALTPEEIRRGTQLLARAIR
ncbi:PLP-dependent aminotransferase family protein [Marinibaculum pumilum]|uniref:PLP-dependent aminotransferase family protein n=1 Tax=Marinibaculum pumilum TaxID=1766165 RepID=A0ABV7KZ01_9PROT